MKITSTIRMIEITVHESSVTTRCKRTIVRRGGEPGEVTEIEERTADLNSDHERTGPFEETQLGELRR